MSKKDGGKLTEKRKRGTLPWEYCECGCHGHEVRIGTLYYWMFNDLRGGFHLYTSHGGFGAKLDAYSSFEEADIAARKNAKLKIRELCKKINDARKMLRK